MLVTEQWLLPVTRIVVVEFTVYNVNLNLFIMLQIGLEIPSSGQVVPFSNSNTVVPLRYESGHDYAMLTLEILILIYFSIEYLYLEVYEISMMRRKYFKVLWNWYELLLIAVSQNYYFHFIENFSRFSWLLLL